MDLGTLYQITALKVNVLIICQISVFSLLPNVCLHICHSCVLADNLTVIQNLREHGLFKFYKTEYHTHRTSSVVS